VDVYKQFVNYRRISY